MQPKRPYLFAMLLVLFAFSLPSLAQSAKTFGIEITDKGFTPAQVRIPAGQRVQLTVHNKRTLPAEFESFPLNREKVVPPGGTITVWIGPLDPGHYQFFDDFNPGKTGQVIAAPAGDTPSNGASGHAQ